MNILQLLMTADHIHLYQKMKALYTGTFRPHNQKQVLERSFIGRKPIDVARIALHIVPTNDMLHNTSALDAALHRGTKCRQAYRISIQAINRASTVQRTHHSVCARSFHRVPQNGRFIESRGHQKAR